MNLDQGFTRLIIETCKKHSLLRNEAAYVLATAWHETSHTMKPVREYGGEAYLRKKKYYPYVGMGFVQLTWLENYQKATKELGVDFVGNPKKLLEPAYSAEILVIGSKEGWFAGDERGRHKLSRYITLTKSDYVNARRIINGTDKASLIAGHAKEYEADLKRIGYGEKAAHEDPPVSTPQPEPKPNSGSTKPNSVTPPQRGFLAILIAILKAVFKGGIK